MSWHTETQRTSTLPPGTATPLLVLAGVAVYGLYVLAGNVTRRVACGQRAWPGGMCGPLGLAVSGAAAASGPAGQGAASSTPTTIALVVFAVVVVGVGLWGFFARQRYVQSDAFFLTQLRRRDGI